MSRLHTSHRVFLHATVISMVVSSLFTGSVFAADALVSDQTQVPNGNAFILNKIESATASFTHDTTSNFYGTLLNDGETNPVNENYSLNLTVNGTLVGDGSVRAFQNYANNVVFNGSASIVVETNKTLRPSSTSTDFAFFQIDQEGYTANTTFKGNTHIAIKGNSNGNAVFADAVQVNKDAKGNLEFAGNNTTIEASNQGYTAEGILALHKGEVRFTGQEVHITVSSDYGVNGVIGSNLVLNNTGTFNVTSTLTDGYGCNAIGMDVDNIEISDQVQAVNIVVNGAGEAGGGRDGVMGFRTYATGSINSQAFNVSVISPDNAIPEGQTYVPSVGVINYGELAIGDNTQTSIVVEGKHANAVGLLSGHAEEDSSSDIVTTTITGDLLINTSSYEGGSAVAVEIQDGITNLGSQNHSVTLNGDVRVGTDTTRTGVLNMAGTSNVTGNLSITNQGTLNVSDEMSVTGIVTNNGDICLDQAYFSVDGDGSALGSVAANNSTVALGAGTYSIGDLSGTDKTVLLNDLSSKVSIDNKTGDLTLAASSEANDSYGSVQDAAKDLIDSVTITKDSDQDKNKIVVRQGIVNDGLTGTLDENGQLQNVATTKNSNVDGLASISVLGIMQWRHEMSDLTKRLGELRDQPQGVGTWARIYGSEQEYGDQSVTAKSTSIQIGADVDVGAGWKIGAALIYTDGDASYTAGQADYKSYSGALYGTWLAENGLYVDLVGKYSRLDTDFDAGLLSGGYDNNAYSLSAEVGWHFKVSDLFFVEPQAQFTWSRISGGTFSAGNNVTVDQDDFDSYIGRIGLRSGFYFPNNKGTIYARVSGLHDFDAETSASVIRDSAFNSIDEDLGGSWVEFGVGANFNFTDRTYTYVDMEKNAGGEVKENWRWNIGIRHIF